MASSHQKKKRVLKVVGLTMIAVGLGFTIAGMVDFLSKITNFEPPKRFWMLFVGLPCLGFGLMVALQGFRKEIGTYIKNESTPIFNEAAQDMQPAFRAMSAGFDRTKKVCACGYQNDGDAQFCHNCGRPLGMVCPSCGSGNGQDARFCKKCGNRLR